MKVKWLALALAVMMVFGLMGSVAADAHLDEIWWTGQGMDSMDCEEYEPGTMHWVLTQAGNVGNPVLVLYDGEGNELDGDDDPRMTGPVYHFYTSYFDPEEIDAVVYFDGSLATNRAGRVTSQFVLSGYCPECPPPEYTLELDCGWGTYGIRFRLFEDGEPYDLTGPIFLREKPGAGLTDDALVNADVQWVEVDPYTRVLGYDTIRYYGLEVYRPNWDSPDIYYVTIEAVDGTDVVASLDLEVTLEWSGTPFEWKPANIVVPVVVAP